MSIIGAAASLLLQRLLLLTQSSIFHHLFTSCHEHSLTYFPPLLPYRPPDAAVSVDQVSGVLLLSPTAVLWPSFGFPIRPIQPYGVRGGMVIINEKPSEGEASGTKKGEETRRQSSPNGIVSDSSTSASLKNGLSGYTSATASSVVHGYK